MSMLNKKIIKNILPQSLFVIGKKIFLYFLFLVDFFKFRKINNKRFEARWRDRYPQIYDKTSSTSFDRHYVYHTAWAARKIREINPKKHTDISSFIYFSAIASAFLPIEFYDYRPADIVLDNLESKKADLLSLPFLDNSLDSVSCMHTVEHIGLGRYGDKIDPNGDLKAIDELKRVIAPGGSLLFVVPIGKRKIAFNAHRVYSHNEIVKYFHGLSLREFVFIPEKDGKMILNAKSDEMEKEDYGCGCFWFIKENK